MPDPLTKSWDAKPLTCAFPLPDDAALGQGTTTRHTAQGSRGRAVATGSGTPTGRTRSLATHTKAAARMRRPASAYGRSRCRPDAPLTTKLADDPDVGVRAVRDPGLPVGELPPSAVAA